MRQLKIGQKITRRHESLTLEKYLNDISKLDMVNTDEEIELSIRIKKGDKDALQTLVKANTRFVVSVAKQYQDQGLSLADLINEGNIGLIKAAEKFDHTKGFKFISYAVWWIRQCILQALAENSRIVRLPLNQIGKMNQLNKALTKKTQELEREATYHEIEEEFSLKGMECVFFADKKALSIDAPTIEGEDTRYCDLMIDEESLSPEESSLDSSLSIDLKTVMKTLSERERDVLQMSYGIGREEMTLDQIADYYSLTRECIRQIKEKALRRLKARSKKLLTQHL
jgi:RNA polymerase primary sigma factor